MVMAIASVPFPEAYALDQSRLASETDSNETTPSTNHVPGDPAIPLEIHHVSTFLKRHLHTPMLDELHSRLWLVARPFLRIDPIHVQRIKSRSIIPTEDPQLHLTWYRDRIYIKPMPSCLLNHDFWRIYLSPPASCPKKEENTTPPATNHQITADQHAPPSLPLPLQDITIPSSYRPTALGFLRSYAHLIQTPLDFHLARESHLLPDCVVGSGPGSWESWSRLVSPFRHLVDDEVSPRYRYGQLRLTRLNWAVRIFGPASSDTRRYYQRPYWSIGEFWMQCTAPLAFIFATLSVVLSAMQVALSVSPQEGEQQESGNDTPPSLGELNGGSNRRLIFVVDMEMLQSTGRVFWVFSLMVIGLLGMTCVLLLGISVLALMHQITWAFMTRRKSGSTKASP